MSFAFILPPFFPHSLSYLHPLSYFDQFSKLFSKGIKIWKKFEIFDESGINFPLSSFICPVNFAADFSHPESQNLKKQYSKDRKKIIFIYRDEHWLSKRLKRLIS